jgi:hypothetical protein
MHLQLLYCIILLQSCDGIIRKKVVSTMSKISVTEPPTIFAHRQLYKKFPQIWRGEVSNRYCLPTLLRIGTILSHLLFLLSLHFQLAFV